MASLAVERNALPALCERLEDNDSGIKAAAVWCLASIADHEPPLASAVIEVGATSLLAQCLKVSAAQPPCPAARAAAQRGAALAATADG